jgi:hypothetical protein
VAVYRQRISKHVPAATNTHATIELLLETMFSTQSVQRGHKEDIWGDPVSLVLTSAREAGAVVELTVQLWSVSQRVMM